MQMRARRPAGLPDPPDHLPRRHRVPRRDADDRQVRVAGPQRRCRGRSPPIRRIRPPYRPKSPRRPPPQAPRGHTPLGCRPPCESATAPSIGSCRHPKSEVIAPPRVTQRRMARCRQVSGFRPELAVGAAPRPPAGHDWRHVNESVSPPGATRCCRPAAAPAPNRWCRPSSPNPRPGLLVLARTAWTGASASASAAGTAPRTRAPPSPAAVRSSRSARSAAGRGPAAPVIPRQRAVT